MLPSSSLTYYDRCTHGETLGLIKPFSNIHVTALLNSFNSSGAYDMELLRLGSSTGILLNAKIQFLGRKSRKSSGKKHHCDHEQTERFSILTAMSINGIKAVRNHDKNSGWRTFPKIKVLAFAVNGSLPPNFSPPNPIFYYPDEKPTLSMPRFNIKVEHMNRK
ncbi:hypothetical protein Tco_0599563 [Tanacetum coccineum]